MVFNTITLSLIRNVCNQTPCRFVVFISVCFIHKYRIVLWCLSVTVNLCSLIKHLQNISSIPLNYGKYQQSKIKLHF